MGAEIKTIAGFEHEVASHCESGSLRNLLRHAGIEASEPMIFGIGSGPAFYYLFFAKGPSTFPLVGIRNRPGDIVKNVRKLGRIDIHLAQEKTTEQAIEKANTLIAAGTPVAASVEMFRMRYLPAFLRVHAPFHFIVLLGREGDRYAVSDPYHQEVATLAREDLEAAWATHAPMARDNLLGYVRNVPGSVDWKGASAQAIKRTCRDMLLPPVVNKVFAFVGVEGMRTYAKAVRQWTAKYRGFRLREGILFNAVAFEDQGTGGAAFRLMYGAFLQEVADLWSSSELRELAEQLTAHGRRWRSTSRKLVVLGRGVPMKDEEFDDWFRDKGSDLESGLAEVATDFEAFADVEAQFFRDLRTAASRLG